MSVPKGLQYLLAVCPQLTTHSEKGLMKSLRTNSPSFLVFRTFKRVGKLCVTYYYICHVVQKMLGECYRKTRIGESLLTSWHCLHFSSLTYDVTHRSHGHLYQLNSKVERALYLEQFVKFSAFSKQYWRKY